MTVPEPIHPGEHLAEILQELGITQYCLAKTIGVPQIRIQASSAAAARFRRTRRCASARPSG